MTVNTKIGKITANKETMNIIAMVLYDAFRYNEKEYPYIAKDFGDSFDEITEALQKAGYIS